MTYPDSPIRQLLNDIAWPDSTFRKAPSSMPTEDWDLLFLAVQTRLKNCANAANYRSSDHSNESSTLAVQNVVRECVHALEALHSALKYSRNEYF